MYIHKTNIPIHNIILPYMYYHYPFMLHAFDSVPKSVHQKRYTKKKEQKARMISPKHTSDEDASNSVQRVFNVPHQVSSQQLSKENSEISSPSPAAAESGGNRSDSVNHTEVIAADSVEGEGTSLASNNLPKGK